MKDEIEKAERVILIYSWVGCIAAVAVIVSGIMKIL